ncbi:hypothetical protein, partial [Saliniramus sp.]|uniref:hypothetical protein n=1 Tax=Saliniramus sp. TaxID=2986772 RepID=UPI002C3D546A
MSKSGLGEADDLRALEPATLRRRGRSPGARGRTRWRRIGRRVVIAKAILVLIVAVAFGAFYWRVSSEPVRFAGLTGQITATLEAQLGEGWRIEIGDAALDLHDGRLALAVADVSVRDARGGRVASAPAALIPVSTWSLVAGAPRAHGLELVGVELRLQVSETGALSLTTPGSEGLLRPELHHDPAFSGADLTGPEDAGDIEPAPIATVAAALGGFIGALIDPQSPIGAVAEAGLIDARLTMVDSQGRERVGFSDVDARFERIGDGRRINASLTGSSETWHIEGVARPVDGGGGGEAALRVTSFPISDALMMAGLSGRFATQAIALDIELNLSTDAQNRLDIVSARLENTPGRFFFNNPEAPVLSVGRLAASVRYDHAGNAITIPELRYTDDGTRVVLRGNARPDPESDDWQVYLAGRNGVLSALEPGEPDMALPVIDLFARVGPSGVLIEELSLTGEGLDVAMTLSTASDADAGGLRAGLEVRDIAVRDALRIWPPFVAHKPREFLLGALRDGRLAHLSLATTLTGDDFGNMRKPAEARLMGPLPRQRRDSVAGLQRDGLPPDAIDLSFAITDATFQADPGLPPLQDVHVSGRLDGRSARLRDGRAVVALEDGRRLDMSGTGFDFDDFWMAGNTAAVTFRLEGGADALASLIRSPQIARDTPTTLDPDAVSGNAVLDVALAPQFSDAPDARETSVAVSGRLSDVTLRDAFGEEDLRAGDFSLGFRNGALDLAGEARLGEDPVTLAVSRPRDAPL